MESLIKVLNIIFAEHYVALLVLSLSWLLIYGFLSLGDLLARKILVRIPFYLWIQLKRRELGLPYRRNAILLGEPMIHTVPRELTLQVGKLLGAVDKEISRMRSGEHWVARFLRDESIYTEVVNIVDNEWATLESDDAVFKAASDDPITSQIGLLGVIGNPDTKSQALGLLFHFLHAGPPDTKKIAFYHIVPEIKNSEQLEKLESMIYSLPASVKQMAETTVHDLRKRFPSKGSIAEATQVS